MDRAPTGVLVLDIQSHVVMLSRDILGYLRLPSGTEAYDGLVKKLYQLSRDMIDDIVTENLYWTKDNTVAVADRYIKTLPMKAGAEEDVWDIFEAYIVEMELMIDELHILPSWSFFEISLKSHYVVIHRYGDFRIEDWMKKNRKKGIKKPRLEK